MVFKLLSAEFGLLLLAGIVTLVSALPKTWPGPYLRQDNHNAV